VRGILPTAAKKRPLFPKIAKRKRGSDGTEAEFSGRGPFAMFFFTGWRHTIERSELVCVHVLKFRLTPECTHKFVGRMKPAAFFEIKKSPDFTRPTAFSFPTMR
jgi:hypothetical protein